MIKKIYIAGPLFNAHERNYLELIASELEGSGYKCFLPHRDQSGIDDTELEGTNMSQATKDKIFNACLAPNTPPPYARFGGGGLKRL